MYKTKTLVVALSAFVSLAAVGLTAGAAQAQTRSDRANIAMSEFNSALDRAQFTSFRGFAFRRFGFRRFHRFHFFRFGGGHRF